MAKKDLPDIETLRQLVRYEPETGKLYWLPRTIDLCPGKYPKRIMASFNTRWSGKEITKLDGNGYIQLEIYGCVQNGHVVAWSIYNGYVPSCEIDHLNGIRTDNRICNLREATDKQQGMNRGISSRNTSGVKGISFQKGLNKWRPRIQVNGKSLSLGCFDSFDEAVAARKAAEAKYYGEYARVS